MPLADTPPPCATTHERTRTIHSIRAFQGAHVPTSLRQTLTTIPAMILCYAVMLVGFAHGHTAVLLLAPVAAGLAIRIFSLQHDCGHLALFASPRANRAAGLVCSLLTFTPFDHWRRHHTIHHSGWNNIDCRGRLSDMYSDCITVAEYRAMRPTDKILYRLMKNPVIAVLVMPPIIFFLAYRVPFDAPDGWRRERMGVHLTNVALLVIYGGLAVAFGPRTLGIVLLSVIYPAAVAGVWLFLLQHKFEGVHWQRGEDWNAFDASLSGCSFLRLPPLLTWFTGNIGLHHVHHAAPGIPNYRLAACHEAHPVFHGVKIIGMREGLRETFRHVLWDEDACAMVPFRTVCRSSPLLARRAEA